MKYKITYNDDLMATMFVRVADDAILYCNANESFVKIYADGFCTAKNEKYYME